MGDIDEDAADLVQNANARNNAQFMMSGMVCSEQIPFSDIDAAIALPAQMAIPALSSSDALLATEIANCTNYPMGAVDPSYSEPVSSDVPVLILHGEFDVRTALDNALTLADQLDNATLVVVPQAGHETMAGNNCASRVGREFLREPQQTLDTSCIEAREEQFSLPSDPLE